MPRGCWQDETDGAVLQELCTTRRAQGAAWAAPAAVPAFGQRFNSSASPCSTRIQQRQLCDICQHWAEELESRKRSLERAESYSFNGKRRMVISPSAGQHSVSVCLWSLLFFLFQHRKVHKVCVTIVWDGQK